EYFSQGGPFMFRLFLVFSLALPTIVLAGKKHHHPRPKPCTELAIVEGCCPMIQVQLCPELDVLVRRLSCRKADLREDAAEDLADFFDENEGMVCNLNLIGPLVAAFNRERNEDAREEMGDALRKASESCGVRFVRVPKAQPIV